jgi:hypothetical protein
VEGEERRAFVSLSTEQYGCHNGRPAVLLLLQSIVYRVTRRHARFPVRFIRYRVGKSEQ